jgi:hypothetical protein
MKKVLLLIALACGVSQLKAQTSTQPLLSNKPYWDPYLKPKTNNSPFKLTPILPRTEQPKATTKNVAELAVAQQMVYNMPIVKLQNTDRMPIARTDEPGMRYNMPIAGYTPPKQDSLKINP